MPKDNRRLRVVQAVTATTPNRATRRAQTALRGSVKYGKAIPKILHAELRGFWRFMMWLNKYINAANYSDMRDGKPTNARAHHDIVKERRLIAGFWLFCVLCFLGYMKSHYGQAGLIPPALFAATGLFYWGKDMKILDPVDGAAIGISETSIRLALAVAVLRVNLEKYPDAWKRIKVIKGLRQDGETMRMTLALPGSTPGTLARTRREQIASCLELTLSQLIIDPDPDSRNTSELEIIIHPGEPWSKEAVVSPLGLSPHQTCIWDALPFATDVNGRQVTLELPYKAMLLGGLPDMGKTTAALSILMHAMCDPWVRIWTMDAKGIDFPGLAPMAWRTVGNSQDDAISMLQELYRVGEAKMDRIRELGKNGLNRELQESEIRTEMITPLCFVDVLIVDELRFFTDGTDKAKSREITALLSRIVEVFRAAGVIVVCATQRPHSSVVDTSLRDIIRVRAALASTTWQSSNTILGDTAYKMGYSSTEFGSEDKGVMWLRELKKFTQCRAYWVPQDVFNSVCRFAFDLRNTAGTLPEAIAEHLVPAAPPFLAKLRAVIMAEGQGRLPTKEILQAPEFKGYTADTLGKEARKHHLSSSDIGSWGDRARVRGYKLDDIAVAVAECAKDPEFKPGIRGVVSE